VLVGFKPYLKDQLVSFSALTLLVRSWLPETDSAKVLLTSDQVGLYLASTHKMAPPGMLMEIRPATHLSTPEG